MKWHKFDVDFWGSETAFHLQKQFGYRGIVQWLRLISAIAKDIQSWSDVQLAHDRGWKKPLKEWAKIAGTYEKDVKKMLTSMQHLGKIDVEISGTNICTLKFKNFPEFVHKDALSSKSRKHRGGPDHDVLAGHTKAGGRALDKIRVATPPAAGPVGSPGRPVGYHGVDSNGWNISAREQQILDRAALLKSGPEGEDFEEPIFAPVFEEPELESEPSEIEPESSEIWPVIPTGVKGLDAEINKGSDGRSFDEKRALAQAKARVLLERELGKDSGGSLGLLKGPAPAKGMG